MTTTDKLHLLKTTYGGRDQRCTNKWARRFNPDSNLFKTHFLFKALFLFDFTFSLGTIPTTFHHHHRGRHHHYHHHRCRHHHHHHHHHHHQQHHHHHQNRNYRHQNFYHLLTQLLPPLTYCDQCLTYHTITYIS